MKNFASVTAAFIVAFGSVACESATEPMIQDPAGTMASEVSVFGPCEIPGNPFSPSTECTSAILSSGASALLRAEAKLGSQDVTSQCSFVWRAKPSYVRIIVNPTTQTAIVSREWSTVYAGAITVTASCNGVSGPFNVYFQSLLAP